MTALHEPVAGAKAPATAFLVPLVIRGRAYSDNLVEHPTRRGGTTFATPDVSAHLDELGLRAPAALSDLYDISFEQILDYLDRLGRRLALDDNRHLQEAFELSQITSGLPPAVLEHVYRSFPARFEPDRIRDVAERVIGIDYLEGWVPTELSDGTRFSVRAFGSRSVHIIAGNLPLSPAVSIIRNAIIRSDAILKAPSNDPATASAIALTMCELDPDHPITRHLSVAYWKGGDSTVEDALYVPQKIEKILAYGGESSMRHVRKYMTPGLEIVALDPKLSATIIGRDALVDEAALADTAARLAMDVGGLNQEGCVNARVVYVQSGTDAEGLATLRRLGELTYAAIVGLPEKVSGPAKRFDPELRGAIDALGTMPDLFEVIGGTGNEGAVVVSLSGEPVDFASLLSCRVANIVPIDSLDTALESLNAYTQTVGVYPPELKRELRDAMALHGAQRIPTLGHAIDFQTATPQDGMEALRRMCKWIVDEDAAGLPLSET